MSGPIVTVSQGQLQGKTVQTASGKEYHSFQGIPYAKPPIGSLRFKAPVPAEPWNGVRQAIAEGNKCPQFDFLTNPDEFQGNEDCLYLNVYTPTLNSANLPIMFWVHGGGYQMGSGDTDFYGPDFLVEKDVVVVTINYRLNVLGFLCLNTPEVPGNAGLKDQALALKWVKKNACNFGGDPNNITVFGESAGGGSVSYLTLSPLSKDLINKAIMQSGNAISQWGLVHGDPVENAIAVAKALGHEKEDVESLLEFYLNAPVDDLVRTTKDTNGVTSSRFVPVKEKIFPGTQPFISELPIDVLTSGRSSKVPIMIGNTSTEGALILLFLPQMGFADLKLYIPKEFNVPIDSPEADEISKLMKEFYFGDEEIGKETLQQYLDFMSDVLFNVSGSRYVNYLRQSSTQPIFEYQFSYQGNMNMFMPLMEDYKYEGVAHGDELCYLFAGTGFKEGNATPDDVVMRGRTVDLWTNFAKFGNPTADQSQSKTEKWLPVDKTHKYYFDINKEFSLKTDQFAERIEFWNGLYDKYFRLWNDNDSRNSRASLGSSSVERSFVQSAPAVKEDTIVQSSPIVQNTGYIQEKVVVAAAPAVQNGHSIQNGSISSTVQVAGNADVIRANDPPEDDLPKNIGVNKFVNFFESLGAKKD